MKICFGSQPDLKERYVLFTNLTYVTVGAVRVHACALLLVEECRERSAGPRCLARAFGTEASWPVFDMPIGSIAYELAAAQSASWIFGDGDPKPLLTGAILRIQGEPDIQLVADDDEQSIDVSRYEGDEHTILKVWPALEEKVARYWNRPAMPRLTFLPPEMHAPSRAAQWGGGK
jgi:hypothetical protein